MVDSADEGARLGLPLIDPIGSAAPV